MKKILILFGGNSFEHNISCLSAKTIIENIDTSLYDITAVGITKDNNWYIFDDNLSLLETDWTKGNLTKVDNIINFLKSFDKVFPIIHGTPFEDGSLQGLFSLFDIPYVGSNLENSIISYDKDLTKLICREHQIPVVPSFTLNKKTSLKSITLDFPVIVKPSRCGSSIGINIANDIKELNYYLDEAFKYDDKVLVEKFIKARELECAILEDKKNYHISMIGEIKPSNDFYDYDAKYVNDSELIIPAKISKDLTKDIQDIALKVYQTLGLKDLARVDFLYDYNNNQLYFNEVNTMPGFTTISMYPLLFTNDGIPLKKLITKLIEE